MDFSDNMKKSVIGPIISVFVMVLIVSILAGLTFLFVTQLKDNVVDTSTKETFTVINESGSITGSGYTLANIDQPGFSNPSITYVDNATSGVAIASGNYTLSSEGYLLNASAAQWSSARISYTYSAIATDSRNAYLSTNTTEAAGSTVVNYLSLIFLAVIFGAILTLVLKVIMPYINLGQQMGEF